MARMKPGKNGTMANDRMAFLNLWPVLTSYYRKLFINGGTVDVALDNRPAITAETLSMGVDLQLRKWRPPQLYYKQAAL